MYTRYLVIERVIEGEIELASERWMIEFTRERAWESDWLSKRVGESVSAPKEWETWNMIDWVSEWESEVIND